VNLADVVGAMLFAGIMLYAIFGGADFGSGIWDLLAGGDERGGSVRRLIDHSIGPVWEANHVWLVFVLVFLWTGFPTAFGPLMSTLYVPMSLVAVGIVLRGAGFAFRKFSSDLGQARLYGFLFALSSLVTPFFLGTVAGAVASGRVPATGSGDRWTSWTGPTSLVGGVLAVLTCALLAAVFLAADAERLGRADLVEWARTRALAAGVVTGVVALAAIALLADDAETLYDGLTGWGAIVLVASAVAGTACLWLVWNRRLQLARVAAVAAVGAVVAGWGVGQYPWVLVDTLEIDQAAGARPTLWGLVIGFGLAAIMVVPSLGYLFLLANRGSLSADGEGPS